MLERRSQAHTAARTTPLTTQSNDLSDLPGRDGLGTADDSSGDHLASITDASAER